MSDRSSEPQIELPCGSFVRLLLPSFVEVEEGPLLESEHGLFPEETVFIKDAVTRRRLEFATGRAFARRALEKLGGERAPLLQSPVGVPCWPEGFRGSITHGSGYCAVAVMRCGNLQSVGIDVERIGRISSATIAHIATQREVKEILSPLDADEMSRVTTILFSAKEALFKSSFLLDGKVQKMSDVELELDLKAGKFQPLGRMEEGVGSFLFTEKLVAASWLKV